MARKAKVTWVAGYSSGERMLLALIKVNMQDRGERMIDLDINLE